MTNSMLGLILIGQSKTGQDEMAARPDADGCYGPLDEILSEFARDLEDEKG